MTCTKTITVSIENLLWYIKWHKIWHDNSVKQNTYLAYYKWQHYWHEYRPQTNNNEGNNNTENTNEEQEWNE
jgi:hypothetical protein